MRTVNLTSVQYTWTASLRNVAVATLGAVSPMYIDVGAARLLAIVVAIAIFGLFALIDDLIVRIEGQSPRAYRRSHSIVVPRALYVAVLATMAAIMFFVVWLTSAG